MKVTELMEARSRAEKEAARKVLERAVQALRQARGKALADTWPPTPKPREPHLRTPWPEARLFWASRGLCLQVGEDVYDSWGMIGLIVDRSGPRQVWAWVSCLQGLAQRYLRIAEGRQRAAREILRQQARWAKLLEAEKVVTDLGELGL